MFKQYVVNIARVPFFSKTGQAMVETVLILPILLGFASLIIDLGNLMYVAHRITAASREGARFVTESSEPLPDPLTNCELAACGTATGHCCTALHRTSNVLFNSGIQDANIRGEWFNDTSRPPGVYTFFRLTVETNITFFFGLFTQTVQTSAVAYATG
jgi:hypothetical protein